MKDNKFIKRMSDKGKLTWQYVTMTAITFVIIFAVVMGILFICSHSKAEAITPNNMNVSLIEQKGTPTAQTMLMNINTSKEPENATQGNTEGNMPEYINLGEFRLTAYCSCSVCCEQYASDRPIDKDGNEIVYTASGKIAKSDYTIAADPSVLPYGTIVYINGHRYEVQDCGGAIKGNSVDIYFDNHEEAREFGVQYADVFIERN